MTCDTMTILNTSFDLIAPLSGKVYPIERSADQVFAQRIIGDGFVIDPSSNCVVAPCDGIITQLHRAKHAISIKTNQDIEVLIHIGIDTVKLNGKGFEDKVALKDEVKLGQPLIYFDPDEVSKHANLQTVIIITTGQTGNLINKEGSDVEAGKTKAFTIHSNDTAKIPEATKSKTKAQESREITILNPQGLHARPAAQLIQSVKSYDADITIVNNDNNKIAPIKSLTALLELNTKCGSKLTFNVQAENPTQVLDALEQAISSGLGEQVETLQPVYSYQDEQPLISWGETDASHIVGISAARGMVAGTVLHQYHSFPDLPEKGEGIEEELGQLTYGINKAQNSLEELIKKLKSYASSLHEDVFIAHQELLNDPILINTAEELIKQGKSAMWSWHSCYLDKAKELRGLNNPLLAARADDIEDVGSRVLRALIGILTSTEEIPENTILFLDSITPSEIVSLDKSKIIAICTVKGGATSHAAILASSLNIPYIASASNKIREVKTGTEIIVDANKGVINIAPTAQQLKDLLIYKNKLIEINKKIAENKSTAAVTIDGVRVLVAANIADTEDVEQAKNLGADGIGLTRSEFIFMNRMSAPTVEEQETIYKKILETMAGDHPIVIRTLDAGGDKPISYLPIDKEDNPFLGERGIRIGILRPSILRDQIKALLKSATNNLNIMLPMVSSILELRAVKKLIEEEQNKLQQASGKKINVGIGIMVEVPSVAIIADQFAQEVDFFSIGSNDLIQYTLAVDRGHAKLGKWVDGLDPAVLHLINKTITAAKKYGKWVGICGGMAADVAAVPILVGLGIDELSMSAHNIPMIKQRIRELDFAACKKIAEQALTMQHAKQVRDLIETSNLT